MAVVTVHAHNTRHHCPSRSLHRTQGDFTGEELDMAAARGVPVVPVWHSEPAGAGPAWVPRVAAMLAGPLRVPTGAAPLVEVPFMHAAQVGGGRRGRGVPGFGGAGTLERSLPSKTSSTHAHTLQPAPPRPAPPHPALKPLEP